MKRGIYEEHWVDGNKAPAGGVSSGRGFAISWQNGPLGIGKERKEPNGAFVEDVLEAVKGRIDFYQNSPFKCNYNEMAILCIEEALGYLNRRTNDREARGVEGTHQQ